ncbi:LysR family transcriptional regulator [Mycobacterium sp. URHB0021]|jgi:DNA-binding transcriptional LysR family regulator
MPGRLPSLEVLELLVGVDDHGSLSAAGRMAQISQPNASRAIKQLERRLGLPLVRRSPTGSVLTAQGTIVAHWARMILADAAKLLDVAAGLVVDHSAELTVAASMTVAEHLMPRWLATFRDLHPDITIHLQVHNSTQVIERVTNALCDVGFIESPHVPRGLHSAEVARDRLVLVTAATHPWARRRTLLSREELAATPLLVREPGSGTRTTLEVALADCEMAPPLLELGSASAIRTSVLNGVGPAVLSTLAVADQVQSGDLKVVEVEGLELRRSLRAVWGPHRQLEGPAAELLRELRRRLRTPPTAPVNR